jgi:hypothetical protein
MALTSQIRAPAALPEHADHPARAKKQPTSFRPLVYG